MKENLDRFNYIKMCIADFWTQREKERGRGWDDLGEWH